MKLKIPGLQRFDVGGGGTFTRNLRKALIPFGHQTVNDNDDYDVLFIAGASLATREQLEHASEYNKKIILRVDNILEDSKTGS